MKKLIFFIIFLFTLSSSNIFADDIPIIVISPGKTLQSKSIVGSDVEVITGDAISNSNQFFIGDILDNNMNGINSVSYTHLRAHET